MISRPVALVFCALGFLAALASAQAEERGKLDHFENHIRPLLLERCADCHGDDIQESGFRVDSREALLTGGQRGVAVVAGNAEASLLLRVVSGKEKELMMVIINHGKTTY